MLRLQKIETENISSASHHQSTDDPNNSNDSNDPNDPDDSCDKDYLDEELKVATNFQWNNDTLTPEQLILRRKYQTIIGLKFIMGMLVILSLALIGGFPFFIQHTVNNDLCLQRKGNTVDLIVTKTNYGHLYQCRYTNRSTGNIGNRQFYALKKSIPIDRERWTNHHMTEFLVYTLTLTGFIFLMGFISIWISFMYRTTLIGGICRSLFWIFGFPFLYLLLVLQKICSLISSVRCVVFQKILGKNGNDRLHLPIYYCFYLSGVIILVSSVLMFVNIDQLYYNQNNWCESQPGLKAKFVPGVENVLCIYSNQSIQSEIESENSVVNILVYPKLKDVPLNSHRIEAQTITILEIFLPLLIIGILFLIGFFVLSVKYYLNVPFSNALWKIGGIILVGGCLPPLVIITIIIGIFIAPIGIPLILIYGGRRLFRNKEEIQETERMIIIQSEENSVGIFR